MQAPSLACCSGECGLVVATVMVVMAGLFSFVFCSQTQAVQKLTLKWPAAVLVCYWRSVWLNTSGCAYADCFLAAATPCPPCSLVLVVLTAESWGLLIGGVFMDAKTAQVGDDDEGRLVGGKQL